MLGAAEALVRGGSRVAEALRISSVVIGLTIVAYGTSAPELVVGLAAAVKEALGASGGENSTQLAVGNAVGSNIANIALVLGLAALVRPIPLERRVVRADLPILVAVSAGVVPLTLDGRISRVEGAVLLAAAVAYTVWCVRSALRARAAGDALAAANGDAVPKPARLRARDAALIALGLAGLGIGAHLLVTGACDVAEALGVSKLVIGVTIVAVGTSLPELAASVVAAARGHDGLSVGNVVGSNLFNVMLVLGASSLITPLRVPRSALVWDVAPMLAVTLLLMALVNRGATVKRWHGALLLVVFAVYMTACALRESLGWA